MSTAALAAPLYSVRIAGREAWAWVLSTWIRTYANSEFARPIPPGIYRKYHHAIAERLLEIGELRVASPVDEPMLFCGWALTQPGVLHYAHVKPEFRGLGIGAELVAGMPADTTYTHKLNEPDLTIPKSWTYNPYLVA